MVAPQLKRRKVAPTPLDSYTAFFNSQTKEFFRGHDSMGIDQQCTYVSPLGSISRGDGRELLVGTRWSKSDKDRFFTFLGRYGIKQLDKLHSAIGNKSHLEIRQYYDLLEKSLKKYKKSRRRFADLCTYDEIPAAVEVDELVVEIEEELASEVRKTSHGKNRYEVELLDNELIAYDALDDLIRYYSHMGHLGVTEGQRLSSDVKNYLYSRIKTFTKIVIRNAILTSHYRVSKEIQDEPGGTFIIQQDIINAIAKAGFNRPVTHFRIMQHQREKLDFEIVDNYKFKESPALKDSVGRSVYQMVDKLEFEGLTDRFVTYFSNLESFNVEDPFVSVSTKFITDFDDDQYLDNLTAWYLTSMETEDVSIHDWEVSKEEQTKYLEAIEMTHQYQEKKQVLDQEIDQLSTSNAQQMKDMRTAQIRAWKKLYEGDGVDVDVDVDVERETPSKHKSTREEAKEEQETDYDIDSDFYDDIFLEEAEDGMDLTQEQQLLFGFSFP